MSLVGRRYTIIGGGAIGTTLAMALTSNGLDLRIIEAEPARVTALRGGVAVVDGPRPGVPPLAAFEPEAAPPGPVSRVLLATKAQHADAALRWVEPRLTADGYVVSCQNGDNFAAVADVVGAQRTLLSMIDIAADVLAPGVLRLGGSMDLVVGEPDGRLTGRVQELARDLRPIVRAEASDNVRGSIWGKRGIGAVLTATALADEHVATLVDEYRPLMAQLLAVVYDTARAVGVTVVPVHDCDPTEFGRDRDAAGMAAALDRLVVGFARSAKDRSGVFRDIAVHGRRTEAHGELRDLASAAGRAGLDGRALLALDVMLTELEDGRRPFARRSLDELERLMA